VVPGQLHQTLHHLLGGGVSIAMTAQVVQDIAEQGFAVGAANGLVEAGRRGKLRKLTIMGEDPVAAPELADKRVGVGQADITHIGLAYVADGHFTLDGMGLHHFGNARGGTGVGIVKTAHPFTFIESDAPAILVWAGVAATASQAGKAETEIGRGVGAHGQQFTHGWRYPRPCFRVYSLVSRLANSLIYCLPLRTLTKAPVCRCGGSTSRTGNTGLRVLRDKPSGSF